MGEKRLKRSPPGIPGRHGFPFYHHVYYDITTAQLLAFTLDLTV